ncbi:hypothetical protein D6C99_08293 [Aureobasidium pullulans]|nr:hypothetical protein D6C99_08293 [Aureobasidium pullulans]
MPPKHSLDAPTRPPSAVKRIRTTSTPTVKRSHKANFNRLCTLHNWTPSEKVRDKLADLLSLSGPRLQSSELLPLAFVQFYPFIWVKDLLLLGYNEANDSVWYKAHPAARGIARGRYYNSAQENFKGKQTVTRYWQSWVDVFDIDKKGADRSHEFFTGVYLILKKFPNLRYKTLKGQTRDVQSAIRETGITEYPFNDDHTFMQDRPNDLNKLENGEFGASLGGEKDGMLEEQRENSYIQGERGGSYGSEFGSNLSPRPFPMQVDFRANSRALEKIASSQRDAPTTQTAKDRPRQPKNHARPSVLSRPLSMQLNSRAKSRAFGRTLSSQRDAQVAQTALERSGQHENDASYSVPSRPLITESVSRANSRGLKPAQPITLRKQSVSRRKPVIRENVVPSTHGTEPPGPGISHVENQQVSEEEDLSFEQRSHTHSAQDVEARDNMVPTAIAPGESRVIHRDGQSFREFNFQIPIEEPPRWSTSEFKFVAGPSVETVFEQTIVVIDPAAPRFTFSIYEIVESVPVAPSNYETVEFPQVNPFVEDEFDQIKDEDLIEEEDL